jgi:hypothetical protein
LGRTCAMGQISQRSALSARTREGKTPLGMAHRCPPDFPESVPAVMGMVRKAEEKSGRTVGKTWHALTEAWSIDWILADG